MSVLDPRLEKDTYLIERLDNSQLLLMSNACFPWFILVPDTNEIEFVDLSEKEQHLLLKQIQLVSAFIRHHFNSHKLNTAWIGNIVSQLHIHIVGRQADDPCWPNVVWGTDKVTAYSEVEINTIRQAFTSYQNNFKTN